MGWFSENEATTAEEDPSFLYDKALGILYHNPDTSQEAKKALELLQRSASQGFPRAQNHLGLLYANGHGVPQNYSEAFRYFMLAAEQGYPEAQYYLGVMYENADGVSQCYAEAIRWYRLAAEHGHIAAQYGLGYFYAVGNGVTQDYSEAFRWFKHAAHQGNSTAQCSVGVMYMQGHGVSQDYSEAIHWFTLAADQGEARAQCNLGVMYEHGRGVAQNYAEALRYFKLAADQGYEDAQCNLGFIYENGHGVAQNYSEAFRWYKLAAEQGHAGAQNNLGLMYKNGHGVSQNYSVALRWYRLAADQGMPEAQYNLGAMYENGTGVPQNCSEALGWYELSAAQGFRLAQEAVANLTELASKNDYTQPPVPSGPSSPSKVPQSSATSLQTLLDELNAMTGLANVKSEIYQLIQYVRVQKMRSNHGLQSEDISLHSVFTGSPGTGKTTVARLYGQMLKELGFLSKGHLVETDRTGLVAGYIGQTELKTDEKVREALGGILFIDEAYSLFKGSDTNWDFGQEVISVLLKRMEDHRDDLVVIVAGYPAPMESFLNANEGLRSRFQNFVHFDDYSPDELLSILEYFCTRSNYQMTQDAVTKASVLITRAYDSRDQRFGNARYVRNLFENIRKNQSVRIAETLNNPTAVQLQEILPDDIIQMR